MRRVKHFVIGSVAVFLIFLLLNFLFPLHDNIEYTTIITDNKGVMVNAF